MSPDPNPTPDPSVIGRLSRPALVLTGGRLDDALLPAMLEGLPAAWHAVVAADSGYLLAERLGVTVDRLVGDLDSLPRAARQRAEEIGVEVEQHPSAKDQTDLALAMVAAVGLGADGIVVLGGVGGRLDHLLGNVLSVAEAGRDGVQVCARFGPADVHVARPGRPVSLAGRPGDYVSLFALGGPALGVRTHGLRFALHAESLHPGASRGLSNELLDTAATVSLEHGVLAVVLPEARRAAETDDPAPEPEPRSRRI